MTNTIPVTEVTNAIAVLLTEAYAGPPDPSSTWFIDNEPGAGLLSLLERVPASQATISVDGTGAAGSTIAANAEHLRWSLAQANAALRGEDYQGRWAESWGVVHIDEAGWDRLRRDLRSEFETLRDAIQQQAQLQGEYLLGVLGLIPHAAFHLGLLRQMVARISV